MKTLKLHKWDLTYGQARELQKRLASRVRFTKVENEPRIVAGLDCAFSKDEKTIFAVAVVIKLPDFEVIETANAARRIDFPYIPGLLSFREAPVCIEAIEKLQMTPDIFVIDDNKLDSLLESLEQKKLVKLYRKKGKIELAKATYDGLKQANPFQEYQWFPWWVDEKRKF